MKHTAKLMHDPAQHAHLVTHPDPAVADRLQREFVEKHKIVELGTMGIAFSTICCDNPDTIERHTLGNVHELPGEELQILLEDKVARAAQRHSLIAGHKALLHRLGESGQACIECGE